jgi:hypothetical protein
VTIVEQRQPASPGELDDLGAGRLPDRTKPGREAGVDGCQFVVGLAVAVDARDQQPAPRSEQPCRRADGAGEIVHQVQHVHGDDGADRTGADRWREDVTLDHSAGKAFGRVGQHRNRQIDADGPATGIREVGGDHAGPDAQLDDWTRRQPSIELRCRVPAAEVAAAGGVVAVSDPIERQRRRHGRMMTSSRSSPTFAYARWRWSLAAPAGRSTR